MGNEESERKMGTYAFPVSTDEEFSAHVVVVLLSMPTRNWKNPCSTIQLQVTVELETGLFTLYNADIPNML